MTSPPTTHFLGPRRGWRSTDVLRAAALVIATYVVARLLWRASPLLLTAYIGVLFGLAVSAGVDFLQRKGIPRGLGAPLIVVGAIACLAGVGAWIAPTFQRQSIELQRKLPESLERVNAWLNGHQGGIVSTVLGAPTAVARADSARVTAAQRAPGIGLDNVARYLFPFLSSTVEVFAGILLILFLSAYVAVDPDMYHRGIMHLFPHRSRARVGEVLSAMAFVLRRWLVAQLIGMIAIGATVTVALLVLHVRAAVAIGIISGVLEFIPTFGPILSAVPALAMGFLDSPQKALLVLVVFSGLHILESHLLIPLLMKGSINLPPALTIVTQALMALLFGFLGLMTAVPALAAVMVTVKMLYVRDVVGDAVRLPGAAAGPRGSAAAGGASG